MTYSLNVSQEIYSLCWTFYFHPIFKDQWDKYKINDRYTEVNSNENYMKRLSIADRTDWQYQEGFGTIQVSKGDIQEWKINVKHSLTQYIHVGLGICIIERAVLCLCSLNDKESFLLNGLSWHSINRAFYNKMHSGGSTYKPYGRRLWTRDDVVTMRLDMSGDKYGILSYSFNQPFEDLGIACDDLDINKTYCLAVWIGHANTVQLMNDDYESVWIYP